MASKSRRNISTAPAGSVVPSRKKRSAPQSNSTMSSLPLGIGDACVKNPYGFRCYFNSDTVAGNHRDALSRFVRLQGSKLSDRHHVIVSLAKLLLTTDRLSS